MINVPDGVEILVGCGNGLHGLLTVNSSGVFGHKYFKRRNVFGITKRDNQWWCFAEHANGSKIVSFDLANDVRVAQDRIVGCDNNIHQIDFIGDSLYVADTGNNRILVYDDVEEAVEFKYFDRAIYPNGKTFDKPSGNNYGHFNSVFSQDGNLYVVAHNYSAYTEKKSELLKMDMLGNILSRTMLEGYSCHNYYTDGTNDMFCDSDRGDVRSNGESVLHMDKMFFRGMSVAKDFIIVGASTHVRKVSSVKNSYIFFLNAKSKKPIAQLYLEGITVNEIRRVDKEDACISNSGKIVI